jgi:hypothetical protein
MFILMKRQILTRTFIDMVYRQISGQKRFLYLLN